MPYTHEVNINGASVGEDDGGVEVSMKFELSRAKKRWVLLRNVMRGVRRTSLTKPEEELMGAIDSSQKPATDEEDGHRASARKELRQSIAAKKHLLTGAEAAFLSSLAEADVSSDYLQQTTNVLNKDKLYAVNEDDHEDEDDDDVPPADPGAASGASKEKIEKANTDNFRTDLWRTLQCSTNHLEEEEKEEKNDEDDSRGMFSFKPKEETKSKPSVFTYFVSNIFGGSDSNLDAGGENQTENETQKQDEKNAEDHNEVTFAILGTSVDDQYAKPHVLSPPLMDSLRPYMPYAIQEDNYWLKYSLVRDGSSMEVLLSKVRSSTRTVLAIETVDGEVFGSFTSSPWRRNGNVYYGTGESFLWRLRKPRCTPCKTIVEQAKLESDLEIFKWSGANRNVQLSNFKKIIVGGGEPEEKTAEDETKDFSFGLALNSDLSSGTSGMCCTFGSPNLSQGTTSDVFEILNLELWTMTPFKNEEEAEKLELGRQFVFDHGMVATK